MAAENTGCGTARLQAELRLLGHEVAESTVAKDLPEGPRRPPSQTWRTFLRNHLRETAACDSFVAPTATFRLLLAFVVLSDDRRRLVHFNVSEHPTAEWTARQFRQPSLMTMRSPASSPAIAAASSGARSRTRSRSWASTTS
jgi:putative transposase